MAQCEKCGGTGGADNFYDPNERCKFCLGSGTVIRWRPCDHCGGQGKQFNQANGDSWPCNYCGGSGQKQD